MEGQLMEGQVVKDSLPERSEVSEETMGGTGRTTDGRTGGIGHFIG